MWKFLAAPDVSRYQYDETSGFYYDPTTGLYYDAHSQYYYNNGTGAYLYWDQRKSTYLLAAPTNSVIKDDNKKDVNAQESTPATGISASIEDDSTKKEKNDNLNKPDKVKIAKKIVKDMEKWAKQLNQKKDYTAVATPQPILSSSKNIESVTSHKTSTTISNTSAYADVGFSILEKKTIKLTSNYVSPMVGVSNKLIPLNGSDSEEDNLAPTLGPLKATTSTKSSSTDLPGAQEKDYVDLQKLTCLLCKRAFQSLDVLQKHLKMSNLHKENLAKHNLNRTETNNSQTVEVDSLAAALS